MPTPKNYSVIKAFSILKAFRNANESLSSCELSRRANLPEASGYRLVKTLEKIGAVTRASRNKYRPGPLLVSLSANVALADHLQNASRFSMGELARKYTLTTHLGVLEHGMVTYLAKVPAPGAFPVHTKVGAQLEAYSSALGKILLAPLADREIDAILDGPLVPLTPNTITTPEILRQQLQSVRLQGHALDDRESHVDISCVAVPIFDRKGSTVAALSATDRADRMSRHRQIEIRGALMETANAICQQLYPAVSLPFRTAQ